MAESILDTIKELLGPQVEYGGFDTDIIIHVNSAFMVLKQLGLGPPDGFRITGSDEKWSDFITDENKYESYKTLIYIRVKLVLDPPASQTLLNALQQERDELEWRLCSEKETGGV